ncbi:hypothetical protein [Streptomyces sp. Ru72]|uniref:hypothetical protein n=1 Tax=Streptomyces sp. Ru72 TaxID=2080747 RepID=UPI0015E40161|nr:hypothetical protein [Streptomyces sp. Ru72]
MVRQVGWMCSTAVAVTGREMVKGLDPREVSREVLELLHDIEELLSEKVLKYAVRAPE